MEGPNEVQQKARSSAAAQEVGSRQNDTKEGGKLELLEGQPSPLQYVVKKEYKRSRILPLDISDEEIP